MSRHHNDINDLKTYFNSVIDWISSIFINVEKEMRGLEYKLLSLYEDSDVSRKLGIFEYLLSGEKLEFIK